MKLAHNQAHTPHTDSPHVQSHLRTYTSPAGLDTRKCIKTITELFEHCRTLLHMAMMPQIWHLRMKKTSSKEECLPPQLNIPTLKLNMIEQQSMQQHYRQTKPTQQVLTNNMRANKLLRLCTKAGSLRMVFSLSLTQNPRTAKLTRHTTDHTVTVTLDQ